MREIEKQIAIMNQRFIEKMQQARAAWKWKNQHRFHIGSEIEDLSQELKKEGRLIRQIQVEYNEKGTEHGKGIKCEKDVLDLRGKK